jgi:hypothetical protein
MPDRSQRAVIRVGLQVVYYQELAKLFDRSKGDRKIAGKSFVFNILQSFRLIFAPEK